MPALNEAISQRRFKQVNFFINSGVNLNSKTSDGKTALIQLCELEPEEKALTLAKVLIEKGAKVDKTDHRGRSSLMCAILQKKNKLISLFLREMFNFNLNAKDDDGNAALTHAAATGNLKIVSDIIQGLRKFGLSVDVRNNEGMTPLMVAAKNGHLSCAKVILQEGKASKFIRDNSARKTASEWEHCSPIHNPNGKSKRTIKAALNERQKYEKTHESQRPRTSSTENPTQKHEIFQLFDVYKEQFSTAYRIGYKITKFDEKNDNSCDLLSEEGFELGSNNLEKSTDGNQTRLLFTKGAAVVRFKKGSNSSCHLARKFGKTTTSLSASFPPRSSPRPAKDTAHAEKTTENLAKPELTTVSRPRRPIRSRSEILYSRLKSAKEREREKTFYQSNRLPRISLSETSMAVLKEDGNY